MTIKLTTHTVRCSREQSQITYLDLIHKKLGGYNSSLQCPLLAVRRYNTVLAKNCSSVLPNVGRLAQVRVLEEQLFC